MVNNICNTIYRSTVTKSDIKKLIHKTYYTNRKENYGTICLHNNSITLENVGVGEREYISSEKFFTGCSGRAKNLAEIHTHPGRSLLMSEGDILDAFRRNVDVICIAVQTENKEDRIRCHTLKDKHKDKRIYVDNLKKEIEQIVKQVRKADDRAFKASFSNDEKIRKEAYNAEKEIKDKYRIKAKKLHSLMDDSINWFKYCEIKL